MKWLALFLLAGSSLHFDIIDARGHKASGVSLTESEPREDGWYQLTLTKSAKVKADVVLVWPFDGQAKMQDGPGTIPAIAIERGDARALDNPHVVAALATPVLLGLVSLDQRAQATGIEATALARAFTKLSESADAFEKGLGLLYAKNSADALSPLKEAFKQRQRQLTRVPSEIYPVAMLYGQTLVEEKKFDDASVVFLIALKQKPSDPRALKARAEALQKAGKG